jgi:hypothetical protein
MNGVEYLGGNEEILIYTIRPKVQTDKKLILILRKK